MTNAIEQAKREMYEALRIVRECFASLPISKFESALESYLEQVRQDHEALHETARKRFEDVQALEAGNEKLSKALRYTNETIQRCAAQSIETISGLESQLAKMTRMREVYYKLACDYTTKSVDLESRLAAMTENRDELARSNLARDTAYAAMKNERDDIQLRLHAVDHAYKVQQERIATPMSEQGDRGASEKTDANMAVVIDALRSAQQVMVEYLVPDGIRAKRAMTKLIPLLDNEKLYSALYELEHAEVKV